MDKKNITVSICMITYNHEPYIVEAIEGVMMQKTDFSIELVIGEDCSTDNTRKICLEYKEKYPDKIKLLLSETNLGMSQNFIETLKNSTGKYIAFCEGDDYWTDPLKLQKQVEFLEKNEEYSMCFSNRDILDLDGNIISQRYKNKIYNTEDILNGFVVQINTVVFRNEQCILSLLCRNCFFAGDWLLTYYCSLFGKIGMIDDITAVYRITGEGVWTSLTRDNIFEKSKLICDDFFRNIGFPKNNEYQAKKQFELLVTVLLFSVKRPKYFVKNLNLIFNIWHDYNKMNRWKFLLNALKNRLMQVKIDK